MAQGVDLQESVPPDRDLDDIGVELDCAGREATFGFFGLLPTEVAAWGPLHNGGQRVTRPVWVVADDAAPN